MKSISKLIGVLILFVPITALAQDAASCRCDNDLAFVINYLEHDYSGFADNVTAGNREQYDQLKSELLNQVRPDLPPEQCLLLIKNYISFFRDNHLQVRMKGTPPVDETSEKEVKEFKLGATFTSREKIEYDSLKTWSYLSSSVDPIEGIYDNDVYQVAVIRQPNERRDYYGIITKSKSLLWEPGQVKLEIKRLPAGKFQTILYLRNHFPDTRLLESPNPVFDMLSVKKLFPLLQTKETSPNYHLPPAGKWFQFRMLDDSTNYLYIGTFDGSLKRKFDSAYAVVVPLIQQRPNLIVDVRGNGGGSDMNWTRLARYLYTQPYDYDKTEFYCSPGIVQRDEEMLAQMKKNKKGYGWAAIKYQKVRMKRIKSAPSYSWLPFDKTIPWYARPFVNDDVRSQRRVYPEPKRVVVMFNRNSASAAEGFILDAMHSSKVVTFGENSGGYLTFGNVRVVDTPSGFTLQSATHRTPNRFQYEKVGIPPKVKADPGEDWIVQAQRLLNSFKTPASSQR